MPRALRMSELLQRFRKIRPQLRERLSESSPELRIMLALCGQRIDQLQQSFSSAGMNLHRPAHLLRLLAAAIPRCSGRCWPWCVNSPGACASLSMPR